MDLLALYLCAAFGLCYICYPNVEIEKLETIAGMNSFHMVWGVTKLIINPIITFIL